MVNGRLVVQRQRYGYGWVRMDRVMDVIRVKMVMDEVWVRMVVFMTQVRVDVVIDGVRVESLFLGWLWIRIWSWLGC